MMMYNIFNFALMGIQKDLFSSAALHHVENPVTPRSRSWIRCGYLKRRDARIINIINSIDNMNIRKATMSLIRSKFEGESLLALCSRDKEN